MAATHKEQSMESKDVCVEAIQAMEGVVDRVNDDQWRMTMPADFQMMDPNAPKTLRDVVNRIAYDIAWIPDMLSGRTMDEIGRDKFQGDLLGDDPRTSFRTIADTAIDAIHNLADPEPTVHCSYADYTPREYFRDISSYYGMSAYDIPKAIGIDPALPPALVEGLWEQSVPMAEEWRAMGIIGPKVDVPDDAPLQARLLGLSGRQP
jgi:hypothetical protein